MEKTALKAAFKGAKEWLKRTPEASHALAYGGVIGSLNAAMAYRNKKELESGKASKANRDYYKKHPYTVSPVKAGLAGLILGGVHGAAIGSTKRDYSNYARPRRPRSSTGEAPPRRSSPQPVPEWLNGITSKTDAKKTYRAHAMKHHPDRGGDAEKMKKLNTEWENFEKHHFHKLSFYIPSFFDELNEIYR